VLFISFFVLNPEIQASSATEPHADYYRSKGLQEQQKGRQSSALNFFLKAAAAGPEDPVLYNDIGIVYEELGQEDRAEQYYLRALKINPNYLPVYTNLAYLYLDQGFTDKAKQYFEERMVRAPDTDPWKDKARRELYRLDPTFKDKALRAEMDSITRKLQEEADRKAHEAFTLAVRRSEQHYSRSEKFRKDKKYDQALSELDKALVVTPDNPKILKAKEQIMYEERMDEVKKRIGVATQKLNAGEVDSAKKEFQQILATIPKEAVQ